MKRGASSTSPGVTARWSTRGPYSALIRAGGRYFLGRVWTGGGAVRAWSVYLDGGRIVEFAHRYQAKRAVEAAVSQALREAES